MGRLLSMKLIHKRKYFKKNYIIGTLSIEGTDFKCDTLEPPTRPAGLTHTPMLSAQPLGMLARARTSDFPRVGGELPQKGYYAIPEGSYWVRLCMSSKFRGWRPYLMAVPGRMGIMIHEGNTPSDTRGCILVGENRERGKVLNSRDTLKRLMDYIYKAEEMREPVKIDISS